MQSLHQNVIVSRQKHKMVLAQLEQQITQLERDLRDARKLCSQKDQVCSCDEGGKNPSETAISLKNHIAKKSGRSWDVYHFTYICYEYQRRKEKSHPILSQIL